MDDINKEKTKQPALVINNHKTKVLSLLLPCVLLLFTLYILFIKVPDIIRDAYDSKKKIDTEIKYIDNSSVNSKLTIIYRKGGE